MHLGSPKYPIWLDTHTNCNLFGGRKLLETSPPYCRKRKTAKGGVPPFFAIRKKPSAPGAPPPVLLLPCNQASSSRRGQSPNSHRFRDGAEAVAATPVATLRSQCSDVPSFPPKVRATRCTHPTSSCIERPKVGDFCAPQEILSPLRLQTFSGVG